MSDTKTTIVAAVLLECDRCNEPQHQRPRAYQLMAQETSADHGDVIAVVELCKRCAQSPDLRLWLLSFALMLELGRGREARGGT